MKEIEQWREMKITGRNDVSNATRGFKLDKLESFH
jgi:hypothetical protein